MNDLQKNIFKVIVSIIETDGVLDRFEDKESYGDKKVMDNSSIRYGFLQILKIVILLHQNVTNIFRI